MGLLDNPFAPGAGTQPPELTGRTDLGGALNATVKHSLRVMKSFMSGLKRHFGDSEADLPKFHAAMRRSA